MGKRNRQDSLFSYLLDCIHKNKVKKRKNKKPQNKRKQNFWIVMVISSMFFWHINMHTPSFDGIGLTIV